MRLESQFSVAAPIEEVWRAVVDVERVAPCLPGARILEQTGDDAFRASIKVKLGPIEMEYRGEIEVVEHDAAARRAVLTGRAKEARGQGTAQGRAEIRLVECDAATQGNVVAEVKLAGKVATLGQGLIRDVAAKLALTFAENLQTLLAERRPRGARSDAEKGLVAEATLPVGPLLSGVLSERLRRPSALWVALGGALLVSLLFWRCA